MKKKYHPLYQFGSEDWKQKRNLMRQTTNQLEAALAQEKEKKTEDQHGEEKLKEYLGLTPTEAGESVSKAIDVSHKNIQEQLGNWVAAGVRSKLEWLAGRGILSKIGIVDATQKRRLDRTLERIAKEQAEKEAKVFERKTDVSAHATNSINILGHKLKACNDLVSSLNNEIQELTKRQEAVDKANKGLSKIKNLGARAYDYIGVITHNSNSTLRGRIERMTQMRDEAEKIKAEDEKKLEVKGQKNDQIKEWDENLRIIAAPYLKNEEDLNNFEKKLKKAILEGPVYENVFLLFINKLDATGSEKTAMKNIFSNLIEGNFRGNIWIGSHFEKFNLKTGGITKSDVRNYYLAKVAKFAKTNMQNNPEDKADMLRKCKAGQEIKISGENYILMRNDRNGFLFRKRGDTQEVSYLNARNPENFVLTIHKKNEEGQDSFLKKKIKGKVSASLDTIDFDYVNEQEEKPKGKTKPETETKSNEKEKKR